MNPRAARAFQAAQAAQNAGQPAEALAHCRKALKTAPNHPDILVLGGAAAAMTGQPAEAVKWLRKAATAAPQAPQPLYNLAMLHQGQGELAKAMDCIDRALRRAPGEPRLHYVQGVFRQQARQYTDACQSYREAVRLQPGNADAWFNLGTAEDALERPAAARAAYEQTLTLQPGNFGARFNLANTLLKSGEAEAAITEYEAVLEHNPDFADARVNLGNALQELDHFEDAIKQYQAALAGNPDSREARYNLAKACQADGRTTECLTACDEMLKRRSDDAGALAFRAVALNDAGREGEAADLVDMDRFILPVDIDLPEGYSDIDAFNAALEAHILSHPTLQEDPANHATRNGQHTGELLSDPKGPFAAFEQAVNAAVRHYIDRQGRDRAHPFLSDPPTDWRLTVWAVVMRAMGHQIPHIHPVAWLSGVYYAKLPSIVAAGSDAKEGWLEFGEPQPDLRPQRPSPLRTVQPKTGRLFLFPSYFYHRTVPFTSDETRISIAFDILRSD